MDAFGPISDNAQGIAVMSHDVDADGEAVLTALDADGNTTKAITKGIAIATAVLAATSLFGSYTDGVNTALAQVADRAGVPGLVASMLSYQIVSPVTLVGVMPSRRGHGVPVRRARDRRRDPGGRGHRVPGCGGSSPRSPAS